MNAHLSSVQRFARRASPRVFTDTDALGHRTERTTPLKLLGAGGGTSQEDTITTGAGYAGDTCDRWDKHSGVVVWGGMSRHSSFTGRPPATRATRRETPSRRRSTQWTQPSGRRRPCQSPAAGVSLRDPQRLQRQQRHQQQRNGQQARTPPPSRRQRRPTWPLRLRQRRPSPSRRRGRCSSTGAALPLRQRKTQRRQRSGLCAGPPRSPGRMRANARTGGGPRSYEMGRVRPPPPRWRGGRQRGRPGSPRATAKMEGGGAVLPLLLLLEERAPPLAVPARARRRAASPLSCHSPTAVGGEGRAGDRG